MACNNWASKARHQITIQEKSLSSDIYGGQTVAWSTITTARAQIKPQSGKETTDQDHVSGEVTHKIIIRYQARFKSTKTVTPYRITFDDRIFSVAYIKNFASDMKNEGRMFQEFVCIEDYPEFAGIESLYLINDTDYLLINSDGDRLIIG